jgi:RNA polymerase sigma-70 factor (ECF subfamily)
LRDKDQEVDIRERTKQAAPLSGVLRSLPLPPERWGNVRLVNGLIHGDPVAANVFVDRYGKKVQKRVRYLLGGGPNLEDVVQRVFLELINSIHTVRNPDALSGWVNRVSTFVVSKELRRRQRARWLSFVDEPPDRPVSASQDMALLLPRVRAVFQKMRKTDRIVFVMRFVEEADVAEIADIFEWSVTTARRRIQRARDVFLKKAMRDPSLALYRTSLKNEQ